MIICMCGSPAVGKKSVARFLSEKLQIPWVDLNSEAILYHLGRQQKNGEFVVDVLRLRNHMKGLLRREKGTIIAGHLVPDVVPPNAPNLVAVLRCNPVVLKERYRLRRYSEQKTRNNLGSEILDIPLAECIEKFGKSKVIQIDATIATPGEIATKILNAARGKLRGHAIVNWLKDADPNFLATYFETRKS